MNMNLDVAHEEVFHFFMEDDATKKAVELKRKWLARYRRKVRLARKSMARLQQRLAEKDKVRARLLQVVEARRQELRKEKRKRQFHGVGVSFNAVMYNVYNVD